MKRKFVTNIFIVLFTTVCGISALHYYVLRAERIRQIDRDIETTASALISSDISNIPIDDFEEAEEYLHEVLGTKKLAKIILLRSPLGEIVYANSNAIFAEGGVPLAYDWNTVKIGKHGLRLLGVKVPKTGQILQVGVLMDRELAFTRIFDSRFVVYCGVVAGIVLIVAFVLAGYLLAPLRTLALYLDHVSNRLETGDLKIPELKAKLLGVKSSDEFSHLLKSVKGLTDKIKDNVVTFQGWSAQMAHELKTPMTILRNSIEKPSFDKNDRQEAITQIDEMNNLISSFLEWSYSENSTGTQPIHSVDLVASLEAIIPRYQRAFGNRISIVKEVEPKIFAPPEHVHQLLKNLIENALKYSPSEKPVKVIVKADSVEVIDEGMGLPEQVQRKLGSPFNFFKQNGMKGTGLGLAWVITICKRNQWTFAFTHENGLSHAVVNFHNPLT